MAQDASAERDFLVALAFPRASAVNKVGNRTSRANCSLADARCRQLPRVHSTKTLN